MMIGFIIADLLESNVICNITFKIAIIYSYFASRAYYN